MKKKIFILLFSGLMIASLAACGSTDAEAESETPAAEDENPDTGEEQAEEQKPEGRAAADFEEAENRPADLSEAEQVTVAIYYPGEDQFEVASESIYTLDIAQILDLLSSYGAVPEETSFISLRTEEEEEGMVIYLDMEESFATYMQSLGSTEEYYSLGSIVNTLLDAFEAEKIQITVNGETFETGHQVYDGYLMKYE